MTGFTITVDPERARKLAQELQPGQTANFSIPERHLTSAAEAFILEGGLIALPNILTVEAEWFESNKCYHFRITALGVPIPAEDEKPATEG